jgi:hypothetical protein
MLSYPKKRAWHERANRDYWIGLPSIFGCYWCSSRFTLVLIGLGVELFAYELYPKRVGAISISFAVHFYTPSECVFRMKNGARVESNFG